MNRAAKRIMLFSLMVSALAVQYGCGGEGTNAPATKLTASTVTSASTNSHSHTVAIPFTDLGATSTANYRSSTTDGHSHVIALSQQQYADLSAGKRVVVTSTAETDGHSHVWEIMGGNVLYESLCYNCHSNDKRGVAGMPGITLSSQQSSSLANPAGAPLSVAASATPDPGFTSTTTTATLDGAALYASYCAGCHGTLATTLKRGRTAAQIKTAIVAPYTGMGSLSSLTDAQIQAIATALQ